MKGKDWVMLGALGLGAYLLYRLLGVAEAVPKFLTSTGETIGGALFDWINPNAGASDTYYNVAFPDATRHSVPSSTVNALGAFSYKGVSYILKTDAKGNHVALPL